MDLELEGIKNVDNFTLNICYEYEQPYIEVSYLHTCHMVKLISCKLG